jgi:hypothetical protein
MVNDRVNDLATNSKNKNIRDLYKHTAETLVPDPSLFEFELAIEMLIKIKLTGSDQILAELFQAGGYNLRSIHSSVLFGIRKYFLFSGRSLLLYQFTRSAMKLNVIIIIGYHCNQLHTKFYSISFSQG